MKKTVYKLLIPVVVFLLPVAAKAQYMSTICGTYNLGFYSGDNGPAIAAELYSPSDLAFDTSGNLYIADFFNNVVRKIDTAGIITTVAGTGFGAGDMATGDYTGNGGPAIDARMNGPYAVAVSRAGNLYIADGYNHVVRKVNTAGIISAFAGNDTAGYSGDNGPATAAKLNNPVGLAVDDSENVFIADDHNNVIRKVNAAGIITTFAGDSTAGYLGDHGPATSAYLNLPLGVALDKKHNLYITDAHNNVVRKVDTAGIITTFAGSDTAGGYTGDNGPATAATLQYPTHLSTDDSGNVYIADAYNNVIRKVNTAGIITTFAGDGTGASTTGTTGAYGGDGDLATAAQMALPHGVAMFHTAAKVYIADRANDVIRLVGPQDLTGVKSVKGSTAGISVYPNPASGGSFSATITSAYNEDVALTITNVMGATIKKSATVTNKPTGIKTTVAPGVYFITATTAHGTWNKQIVIE